MGADLTKEISLLWPGKDGRKMYHDVFLYDGENCGPVRQFPDHLFVYF